jgi:hypothetical protein
MVNRGVAEVTAVARGNPSLPEYRGPASRRAATSSTLSSQLDPLRDVERVVDTRLREIEFGELYAVRQATARRSGKSATITGGSCSMWLE